MNKTTVTRSLLYAAAVGAGMSALWLDYPIMVLDRPIRILLVREAIFIAAVAAVWLRFFASTLQGRSGLFR